MVGQSAVGGEAFQCGALARVQHDIHRARPRLTQWPGGQQKTIAHPPVVEHTDVDVALQRQVLQAVVTHQHAGAWVTRQQGPCSVGAARGHKHGGTGFVAQQGGLITCVGQRALGAHLQAFGAAAAITARQHAGLQAPGLQVLHECNHHRGFTGTSGHHVAHHDDRHRDTGAGQPAVVVEPLAQGHQQAVRNGQGPQQPGQCAALFPCTGQAGVPG